MPLPAAARSRSARRSYRGAASAYRGGALLSAVCAALFGILLAAAPPASAHAALTGSSPAANSVVDSAPEQVVLTFSEGVSMTDGALRVLGPDGERVDTGTVRDASGTDAASGGDSGGEPGGAGGSGGDLVQRAVGLTSGLDEGTYTVAWQAVSADSHPVSGAFTFSLGAPSETSADVPEAGAGAGAGGGAVGSLYEVGRYAAYAGFVLLVGGSFFALVCRPRGGAVRPVHRLVVTGWIVLTTATLALLLLRTPYTGSGLLSDVADLGGLREVLGTKPGTALVSRLLLLGAAGLYVSVLFGAYARRGPGAGSEASAEAGAGRPGPGLVLGLALGGGVLAAGLAVTWAAAEHASTGIQTGVAIPVDVVHLLAMAVWLGGLAALAAMSAWGPPVRSESVRRFSQCAFWSVAALVATGVYQSWRQVGSWNALTGTAYGKLLIAKVALVLLLVAVAWTSRRWTARLREPADATDTEAAAGTAGTAGTGAAADGTAGADGTAAGADAADTVHPVRPADAVENGVSGGSSRGSGPQEATVRGDDPARAAQLARQREAADAARRRRARDADPGRAGLRRSVLVETALAIVVLAVTTALTGTEPARTAAAADGTGAPPASSGHQHGEDVDGAPHGEVGIPFDTGGPHGKGTAELRLDPGRTGENTLRLTATGPDGEPVDAPEVKVAFTLPAKDIGPLSVTPEPVKGAKGRWQATDVRLPLPGAWEAAVTVRTSDIDQVTETRTLHID